MKLVPFSSKTCKKKLIKTHRKWTKREKVRVCLCTYNLTCYASKGRQKHMVVHFIMLFSFGVEQI